MCSAMRQRQQKQQTDALPVQPSASRSEPHFSRERSLAYVRWSPHGGVETRSSDTRWNVPWRGGLCAELSSENMI